MIGPFTVSRRGISAPIGRDYNLLIQQLIHEILVVLDDPGDFPMFLSSHEHRSPGSGTLACTYRGHAALTKI